VAETWSGRPSEGQAGQHVVRSDPDAHVVVRDLHRAELPVVLQAHIGLHLSYERLAARQLALRAALRSWSDA